MRTPPLVLGLVTLATCLGPLHARTPIDRVDTTEPVVALTFDDGPDSRNTPLLLDLFAREKIRVTFFEVGRLVRERPALARAITEAGHEIGNHSFTHANLGEMTDPAAIRAELTDTQAALREATGLEPKVFRAPYIAHGPALWSVLDELRLPSLSSGVQVGDWTADVTAEEILQRASEAKAGDILLLHTWQNKTLEVMPELILRLRAKGLRFVTISELLALAPREPQN